MARRILIGLLACSAVWAFGTGIASSNDDEWDYGSAGDLEMPGPPDLGALSAYGEWAWEPDHGRVWRPSVEAEWRPYWRGHWAWQGTWVWVSADPWGDAPFHYGEWVWSHRLGWVWIPGAVWAPAHVTWVVSGPVVAWAPAGIHVSVGLDPRFWVYADIRAFRGAVVRPYRVPPPHASLRQGIATRAPGRVFVMEGERREREFRTREATEPRRGFRTDHRATAARPDSRFGPSRGEPARGRMAEARKNRGFDLRDRR